MRNSRIQDIKPEKKASKGIFFFLSVFAIAAIVYFVGAAKVGNFISEKFFTPVISWITGKEAEASPSSDVTVSDTNTETKEIEITGSTIYALQVGAYSQKENAEAAALSLQQKGGAGFLYEDSDVARVFIAAYMTKNEAENVQARLLSEQTMETKIYNIETNTTKFSITANTAILNKVQTAAEHINTYQETLISLALDFDKGNVNIATAAADASELRAEVEEIRGNVDALLVVSSNDTIKAISTYYEAVDQALSKLTEDLNTIEMSAYIKECYMAVCFAKKALITSLSL